MIERIDSLPEGVVGLRARGEVTRDDYEQVVAPALEAAHRAGGRFRFLFHFAEDFERFTVGAAWEDLKVGLRYLRQFERCAVVADAAWIRGATRAFGVVMPGRVRTFTGDQLDDAVAWLGEPKPPLALSHRIVAGRDVLVVEPKGALGADDFDQLAAAVDPWIEQHGRLAGIVVHVREFPGWQDLEGMFRHLRFVKDHHTEVDRVALCADGRVANLAPSLARHFLRAEVRQFAFARFDDALAWAGGDGAKA